MDVSQILPNLFVGSYPGRPEDIDQLRQEFGITAVLNVQTDDDMAIWDLDWDGLESHYRQAGVEVRRVPARLSVSLMDRCLGKTSGPSPGRPYSFQSRMIQ